MRKKRRISRIKVKVVIIKNGLALLFAHVFEKYVDFVGASNYIKTKAKNIDRNTHTCSRNTRFSTNLRQANIVEFRQLEHVFEKYAYYFAQS